MLFSLTDAVVWLSGAGSLPGTVAVERFADVTVGPGRVVSTLAHCPTLGIPPAARGVPVTLTAAPHLHIREGQPGGARH